MNTQFLAKQELFNRLTSNPAIMDKINGDKLMIQPATLRLETKMDSETLEFEVGGKKVHQSEIRLGESDVFFFNLAALGWCKETASNQGYDAVQFYPDPKFDSNYLEVETLYNAIFEAKEGTRNTIIPPASTSVFRTVSTTQHLGTSAVATQLASTEDKWHYLGNGIGFIGGLDYKMLIAMGKGAKTNITGFKAVWLLDGFLIPGVAKKLNAFSV